MADMEPGGTIRGLTEEDANAFLLALAKGGKKAREFLNFALNWKEGQDTRGVMGQDQPDSRPRTGLGDVFFGKGDKGGPEGFESYAYGMGGPWHVPEGKVLPEIRPGRAEQGLNMLGSVPIGSTADLLTAGKAGMTMTVPFLMGQVRKATDNITPDVAKAIAEKLLEPRKVYSPNGWRQVDQAATEAQGKAPDELVALVTKYVTGLAGGPSDPLKKTPMPMVADPQFYPNVHRDRGVPLLPPEPKGGISSEVAADFRQEIRPDLEQPSGTYMGSAVDDLVAQALYAGKKGGDTILGSNDLAQLQPDELERLNRMLLASGNQGRLTQEGVQDTADAALEDMAQRTGINKENLPAVLKNVKEDGIVAAKPHSWEDSPATQQLTETLGNPDFWDFYRSLPESELKKIKHFGDLANLYVKEQRTAFDEWGKKAVGPVVSETPDKKGVWMDLQGEESLLWQGIKNDICVGQSSYCNDVAAGKKKIFGLRDAASGKPFATIELIARPASIPFPSAEAFKNRMKELSTLLNDEERAALGAQVGEKFEAVYGRGGHKAAIKSFFQGKDWNSLDAYTNALVSRVEQTITPERLQAAADYFNVGGFNLTPDVLTPKTVYRIGQVKGASNSQGSNIPANVRQEIKRFFDDYLIPQVGADTSRDVHDDYKKLLKAMEGEEASSRFLTEDEVDEITRSIYGQEVKRTQKYGMPWMELPGKGLFTIDRGQLLKRRGGIKDARTDDLTIPKDSGKILSEIARRLKGADEMPENVRNLIAESTAEHERLFEQKAEQFMEGSSWRRWEQSTVTGPDGREVVLFSEGPGNTGYWQENGKIYRTYLNGQGTPLWRDKEEVTRGDFYNVDEWKLLKRQTAKIHPIKPEIAAQMESAKTAPIQVEKLNDWYGNEVDFPFFQIDDKWAVVLDPNNDDLLIASMVEKNGAKVPNMQDATYYQDVDAVPWKVKNVIKTRRRELREKLDAVLNPGQGAALE